MTDQHAGRTPAQSPLSELWAQCDDPGSPARHLDTLAEIPITKAEPETAVAWEGAAARGTVRLEPAG